MGRPRRLEGTVCGIVDIPDRWSATPAELPGAESGNAESLSLKIRRSAPAPKPRNTRQNAMSHFTRCGLWRGLLLRTPRPVGYFTDSPTHLGLKLTDGGEPPDLVQLGLHTGKDLTTAHPDI